MGKSLAASFIGNSEARWRAMSATPFPCRIVENPAKVARWHLTEREHWLSAPNLGTIPHAVVEELTHSLTCSPA